MGRASRLRITVDKREIKDFPKLPSATSFTPIPLYDILRRFKQMEHLRIKLTFTNDKNPYLLDISSLFYDFELLHDFFLIVYADDYKYYKLNNYFWYRKVDLLKMSIE